MGMGYGSSGLKLHSLTDFKRIGNSLISENEFLHRNTSKTLEKWIGRQIQLTNLKVHLYKILK